MALPVTEPLAADQARHFSWTRAPAPASIMAALGPDQAMFVGGCVRDSLLGHPPEPGGSRTKTDIDIATSLDPDQTIRALENAGLKAIPTGYDHGTITAVAAGLVAEITSLRADIDTDGRHAKVQFTQDWQQDWRRRDFTINALYLSADNRLFDPAGGRGDLAARRVRFIGDAATRIREDYLRILRFYRFSARFADGMDEVGSTACRDLKDGLGRISAERITHELLRIFTGPRLSFVLPALARDGMFEVVFDSPAATEIALRTAEICTATDHCSAELMLAALYPDSSAAVAKLRLSRQQAKLVAEISRAAAWLADGAEELRAKELLYRKGANVFRQAAALAQARGVPAPAPGWADVITLPDRWTAPAFPLAAADFKAAGLSEGPTLGKALRRAERQWIDADFPQDARAVAKICSDIVTQLTD